MSFFGMKNFAALTGFWKTNTDQRAGEEGYLKGLTRLGAQKEGKSRAQTTEIRLTFSDTDTLVTITMENGASKDFTCGAFKPKDATKVAGEFVLMIDGNKNRAGRVAKELQKATPGGVLVLTHDSVSLESTTPKKNDTGADGQPSRTRRRGGATSAFKSRRTTES